MISHRVSSVASPSLHPAWTFLSPNVRALKLGVSLRAVIKTPKVPGEKSEKTLGESLVSLTLDLLGDEGTELPARLPVQTLNINYCTRPASPGEGKHSEAVQPGTAKEAGTDP